MVVEHARRLWEELAMAPARFAADPVPVVSPGSLLCPPGWSGAVEMAGMTLITVPDAETAARVTDLFALVPVAAAVLGPATLAYLEADRFRPVPDGPASGAAVSRWPVSGGAASGGPGSRWTASGGAVDQVAADDPGLAELVAGVGEADAGEAGLDDATAPVWVVREGGRIVAASTWQDWPLGVAHLSVLTAADRRGHGLGRRAASAAVAAALRAGRLPQWRARPEASRRIARALGFRELGTQLSLLLRPPAAGR